MMLIYKIGLHLYSHLSLTLQGKLNVEERLQQLPDEIAGILVCTHLVLFSLIFSRVLARSMLSFTTRALLLALICLISSATPQLALRVS